MTGWIKLHRQIKDNWIWQDPEKLRAWLDLLLRAGHEETKLIRKGELLTLKPGQFVTSVQILADSWGWSKQRVYRFFSLLERDGMVNKNGTPNGTIITIVNWDLYQLQWNTNGTTDGTPNGPSNGTPDGTLTRMNKNDKEWGETRARETEEEEDARLTAMLKAKYGEDA